jgi:peptidoglycan hydrolase-like protein with peptidoglycan-binding domain
MRPRSQSAVPDRDVPPYPEPHRRRRRWSLCSAIGVLLACLSLTAGGALASSQGTSMRRSTIIRVQRALHIKADGIAGPQTRRAIRRFQRKHGLKVDGIAGPQTLAALGITTERSGARTLDATSADATTELAKIGQCESGGDPTAVSPDGQYRGKYQFTRATWELMGGTGDPAKASEAVQDAIAAKLYATRGKAPWPNCA